MTPLEKAICFHFISEGFKPGLPANATGLVTGNRTDSSQLQSWDNSISVGLVNWGSAEEETEGQTDGTACVGLHGINQSLVRQRHHSHLFVLLPQMSPRVSIVGRPGGRKRA